MSFPGTVVPAVWFDGNQPQYTDAGGTVLAAAGDRVRRINEASPLTGAWTSPSDAERPFADVGSVRLEPLGSAGGYELTRPAVSGLALNAFTLCYSFVARDGVNGSPGMGLVQTDDTTVGLIASGNLWIYYGSTLWFTTLALSPGVENSIVVQYSPTGITASVLTGGVTTSQTLTTTLSATAIAGAWRLGSTGSGGAYLYGSAQQCFGIARTVTSGECTALLAWMAAQTAPVAFPDNRSLITFVGDSITQGVAAGSRNGIYAFLTLAGVRATYPLTEICDTATPGIGATGLHSPGTAYVPGTTYYEAKRLYSGTRVKNVMSVFLGSNDLAGTNSTDFFLFGTGAPGTAGSGIYPLCDDARAQGWLVNLISPPPRCAALGKTQTQYDADRETVTNHMVAHWREHADAFVDTRGILNFGGPTDPNSTTYYADQVHPTGAGHALLAPYVLAAVLPLLALTPPPPPPPTGNAKFQMQARSSLDQQLYTWLSDSPDYTGVGYTGPGTPLDVVKYATKRAIS